MFASESSSNFLLRLLEWIGVDRSQLPSTDVQFEWTNLPGSAGGMVILLLLLLAGFVALFFLRRDVDRWSPLTKFAFIAGSIGGYMLIAWAMIGPQALAISGILGLGFWVLWVYRWEIETCSSSIRLGLALLRVAVLALLALILFAPEMVKLERKTIQRTVVVARDKSQSMAFEDHYGNEKQAKSTAAALGMTLDQLREKKPSRAKVLDDVLAKEQYKFLRELEQRGKLLVVDFDETMSKPMDPKSPLASAVNPPVTPVANTGDAKTDDDGSNAPLHLEPLVADGRGSDLWLAIHEPLSRSPAAIVLFTDGQHTGKQEPREAAAEALRQNVKLFIVGVGDPSRPKNLRVDNVYVQPNVWRKDEFGVEVSISAQDIEPQNVTLELIEQKTNESDGSLGPEKVVQKEDVLLDKIRMTKTLKHSLEEAGKFVYSVRITPLDEEANLEDNRASSSPTTARDKENLKVLLVAGAPTWEYRLVQKLLTRDETIQVSCWLQTLDEERSQDGDRPPIDHLPLTLKELNEYGVIMLFDPNPMEFDQKWIETLREYISEHSGGVLFVAGPKFTGSFLTNARTTSIRDVIPVRFGDVGAVEVMTMLSINNRAYPLRVVAANSDHDILRFYDDRAQSLQRWESLPGIFWSFPALGPKPTAQVLLEHSDTSLRTSEGARPLMVTGRYGAGNTAYIGFNGTWRWRQMGREAEFFDKFWVKLVRYLADARSSKGRRYGSLETDKDRYEVGDKVAITARLRNAAYEPLKADQVEATLRTEDGAPISVMLRPVMNQPGTFEGHTAARRTGVQTLTVDIPSAEGIKPTVDDKNFTVELPQVEMNQQWLNKPLLTQLAEQTGGKYFELNELDQLAAAVPDQTEKIVERGPSTPVWDLPAVVNLRTGLLFVLVGLLSVEWALRKKFKLL